MFYFCLYRIYFVAVCIAIYLISIRSEERCTDKECGIVSLSVLNGFRLCTEGGKVGLFPSMCQLEG